MNPEALAIKGYSAFPKAPELLKPHHQIVSYHIQDINWTSLTPLQRWLIGHFEGRKKTVTWNEAMCDLQSLVEFYVI